LHWLLTNITKNSGKKIIQTPTPWPPEGRFLVFFENFRRRSIRVLKLHRGFILIKKGYNPQKKIIYPTGYKIICWKF
jgi:hypothetical protein